jgi:O-antigen/teichoic acid export membrane protein
MDLFWALNLGNGFVQLIAGLLSRDLWTLCMYLLFAQAAVAIFAVWLCRKSLPEFLPASLLAFRPLWRLTWPFAALTTLTIASQRLGILSVSAMIGDAETGLYSAAARLLDGMKFGHYAVLGALLPILSAGDWNARNDFRNGFRSLILFSGGLAAIVMLFARQITVLFYGDAFEPAASLLRYICWAIVPYTVSAFISVDMVARGMETRLLRASILSILVFAVLFALFIFIAGLTGAAYAALIGETIQALIFIRVWRTFKLQTADVEVQAAHG